MGADAALIVASFEEHLMELSDAVIEGSPLLEALMDMPGGIKRRQGGTKITFPIVTADDPTPASFSFYDPLQLAAHNPFVRAELEWSGYHGGVVLSKWERKLNEFNPAQVFNLFDEKVNNFKRTFFEILTEDFYGSGAGKDCDGLGNIVDTDNTYANIDRTASGNTYWQSNTRAVTTSFATDTDSDGIANGIESMQLLYLDCAHGAGGLRARGNSRLSRRNDAPNLGLTTQQTWLNYQQELLPQQRYQDVDKANSGFKNLLFMGDVPIVWDRFCTADQLFLLNTDYFELRIVGQELFEADVSREEYSPHAFVMTMLGMFQLVCRNPRYQGWVTNTD